jgi:hypothetical protein
MKGQDLDIPIYYRLKVVMVFGPEVPLDIRKNVEAELDTFMRKKIAPICYNLDWTVV